MRIPNHIRRLLLAALMMLPVWTVMTSYDAHGGDGAGRVFRTAVPSTTDNVCEDRNMPPQDAVLSGAWWHSMAPGVPQGHAGGTGKGIAYYPESTFSFLQYHAVETAGIRRWRLLFGAVHKDQLLALYPTHGFS